MPVFQRRWFMFDFARQRTFDREEFCLFLDGLHRLGYNGLGLYLEGAFAFDRFPGVIRHGVMTPEDAAWAMEECKKRDIFLFPMTNVVGHMEHFFRQERFRDLLMADTVNQLDFLDERAEQFAMDIVHQYTKYFPCGMVHIGGDETKLTEENKVPYAKFLAKICDNLLLEGIKPAIWNDMIWMDPELCQYFKKAPKSSISLFILMTLARIAAMTMVILKVEPGGYAAERARLYRGRRGSSISMS
jgi:hypothetical protein